MSSCKDTSITHAAAAPSNLDAAITGRSAETELESKLGPRATASEIAGRKLDLGTKAPKKKQILKHFFTQNLKKFRQHRPQIAIDFFWWQRHPTPALP